MELVLNKVEYFQVNIAPPRCMKLLPISQKDQLKLNKIIIADEAGIFQVMSIKNGDALPLFKFHQQSSPTSVELGGKAKDKIFLATSCGRVLAFTRKGKQVLDLKTDMTEPIHSMCVDGTEIFIAGEYTFKHFSNSSEDKNFILGSEKITDVLCLPQEKLYEAVPILACGDKTLKVVQGSQIQTELRLSGVPQCLCLYGNDGGPTGDKVLYGTTDGKLGLAKINRIMQEIIWEIGPPNINNSAAISCITNYDMTCNGCPDILVGRENGAVEVYELDELERPALKYSTSFSESVTSIQGGNVSSSDYPEIVCTTFSGWVISLTSEPIRNRKTRSLTEQSSSLGATSVADNPEDQKIIQLKKEIEELEKNVFIQREKYQEDAKKPGAVSSMPSIPVNDRFTFNPDDASYNLILEAQTAIEYVLLQCDVPLHVLDSEKNAAIISFTPCTPEVEGSGLLATFRCQANMTRLEVKVKPVEGQHGIMRAYVTPRLLPKICQVKQFTIRPLSMHYRIHSVEGERPFNQLKLSGGFSFNNIHSWLYYCLPELPEKPPSEEAASFTFKSAYLGTVLLCSYQKGEVTLKSDNVSSISILKDVLTKEATRLSIKLDISCEIDDSSVIHVLQSISPKVDELIVLSKKIQLIDGLKELQTQEGGAHFLTSEFKDILLHSDELALQHKRQNDLLQRLYGMITDLYLDWYKFKGRSVKDRIPKLNEVIKRHNLSELIQFFQQSL